MRLPEMRFFVAGYRQVPHVLLATQEKVEVAAVVVGVVEVDLVGKITLRP